MEYWALLLSGGFIAVLILILFTMLFSILSYKLLRRGYKVENDNGRRGNEESLGDGESNAPGIRSDESVKGRRDIPVGVVEEVRKDIPSTRRNVSDAYIFEALNLKKKGD